MDEFVNPISLYSPQGVSQSDNEFGANDELDAEPISSTDSHLSADQIDETQIQDMETLQDFQDAFIDDSHDASSHSLDEISKLVELPSVIPIPRQRFFWEIFSGPNSPLTAAVVDYGIPCIKPFDIQLHKDFDILNNACYEMMLRVVAARLVGTLHGAPPCTEYSLLKLKGPGPKPCRSPQCMHTPLFDDPRCRERFFSSREILVRNIHLLRLNHIHGGYSSMESPLSAMSWDEDFVQLACQEFLVETAVFSHCQTCETDEEPWNKDWKFVSNIPNFSDASLQCSCNKRHKSFAGKRNADGSFLSTQTAEYPRKLVLRLINFLQLQLMKSSTTGLWDMKTLIQDLPQRAPLRMIHIPDGGGLASSALWPLPFSFDVFYSLRKDLEQLCYKHQLHRLIPKHIQSKTNCSPFTSQIQTEIDALFRKFFEVNAQNPSFDIPADQPFRLHAFYALATLAGDPDAKLLTDLVDGVDLGIHNAIEPSGTWPLKQDDPDMNPNEFSSFETNWKSADTDEITLERLIQREIDDGFVTELPSLDSAKDQFGDLLAIGKLGIATQQADKPRLVLDSTISGLNPASNRAILEKYSYPKLRDLQSSFSQATRNPNVLLNVDVKSAHKRIKVRKEHQGLLAFRFKERIFHYKVLHFGGSCSAYYWTRTAGILLRCIHKFLHLFHIGMVFVDDFVFGFFNDTSALQASLVLMMLSFLNVPLSWNKLELGTNITWIGWNIDTTSDTVAVTQEKIDKVVAKLRSFSSSGKFLRKDVEKLTGTVLWISDMFPHIRWMLGTLYTILSRTGLQLVRLNKQQISFILQNIDEQGTLLHFLEQPFIPQGAILQRLGKIPFSGLGLSAFKDACFDTSFAWTTFLSGRSNRVQIYEEEANNITVMAEFFEHSTPIVPLSQYRRFTIQAGADAFADTSGFGLGAWLHSPAGTSWCSIIASKGEVEQWFPNDSLQSYILSFEMIAQLLVLLLFRSQEKFFRGIDISIATKLDNQAAEAILQHGFTQLPIPARITKAVQIVSFQSRVSLNPFRTSSADNERADDLSRGRIDQEDPAGQIHISLSILLSSIFQGSASHLASLRGVKR